MKRIELQFGQRIIEFLLYFDILKAGDSIKMSNKQIIKINFCGFWSSFKKDNNLFYIMLSKYYDVQISDNPDFLICSNRGKPFEYMRYDCPRIMFMGENLSPDFTVFDYVIGFDYLDFEDRYFRLPFAFHSDDAKPWIPKKLSLVEAKTILSQKKYFCNFIYRHKSANGMRENLFYELTKYKPVISPGSYLNNQHTQGCSWMEKKEFLKLSKFTIAGDSIDYPGFFTEKIIQPFQRHSIPVYFGNPRINDDINIKSFVWCKSTDESEIKATIERVRYLDTHDEAYLEMLMECPLVREDYLADKYNELEKFLVNIFSQKKERAYRRVRHFCADLHESYLREYMKKHSKERFIDRVKSTIKR